MAMPPIYIEEVASFAQAKTFKKKLEAQFAQRDFSIFFNKKQETIGNALLDLLDNPNTSEFVKPKSRALLRRFATQT